MPVLLKSAAILIGSAALSVGVNAFLAPYHLLDGGMIGIGLLMNYIFGVYPGLSIVAISVPLFAVVFFADRGLFVNSCHGLVVSSFLIDLFGPMRSWFHWGMPLHALIGGLWIGWGVGFMLAYETNSGGTDMLAQLVAKRVLIPPAVLIFIMDVMILAFGSEAIGWTRTAYSMMTVTVVGVTTLWMARLKPLGRSIHYFRW